MIVRNHAQLLVLYDGFFLSYSNQFFCQTCKWLVINNTFNIIFQLYAIWCIVSRGLDHNCSKGVAMNRRGGVIIFTSQILYFGIIFLKSKFQNRFLKISNSVKFDFLKNKKIEIFHHGPWTKLVSTKFWRLPKASN